MIGDLWIDVVLGLEQQTWTDWLDLLFVALTIYLIVNAIRRAQATLMLRGLTLIALVLFVVALLLPLPAFSLLVRGILLFMLVAIPVVFQRELRHVLETVGRTVGLTSRGSSQTEALAQPLAHAVEEMAEKQIGALIVIEGDMDLGEIIGTGVTINADVSADLLKAIFYPNNPLHDGATVIRGEEVVAASCVLPVSRGVVSMSRRVGTRHRAAVALSSRSDALVIVVSEETGTISVAEAGRLQELPDSNALRERLAYFNQRSGPEPQFQPILQSLFSGEDEEAQRRGVRRVRRVAERAILTVVLALLLWIFVVVESTELPTIAVTGVPLRVEALPQDLALTRPLPDTVDLTVRTVDEAAAAMTTEAFEASLSLADAVEGVQELAVNVRPRVEAPVRILVQAPETVTVDLAPLATKPLSVTVTLADQSQLPAAYQVAGEPVVEPEIADVVGPAPLVAQVVAVQASVSLSATQGMVEELRPLVPLSSSGEAVDGVAVRPQQAEVSVPVERRADVREAGVAIVTTGQPAEGYRISGLRVAPNTVVLEGPPAAIARLGNTVATLPVNVGDATGDLQVEVPLDVPEEITARRSTGERVRVVQAAVQVTPLEGSVAVSRNVQIANSAQAGEFTVAPQVVELLLEGPLATLQAIEEAPELVKVVVSAPDLNAGDSSEERLQVIAPEGVRVQLVTDVVQIGRR